ncbi:MAG: hypothetical protein JJU29_06265 [Verrucomicrobia bacterium]|nr:hypothetical protein [Verrucomicrobiota bacterium]
MKATRNSKSGQSMLEYTLVLAMTLGILVTLGFFIYVFKEHGGRILDLVSSTYP